MKKFKSDISKVKNCIYLDIDDMFDKYILSPVKTKLQYKSSQTFICEYFPESITFKNGENQIRIDMIDKIFKYKENGSLRYNIVCNNNLEDSVTIKLRVS